MARCYGGNLSQDRIAYEFCKNYGKRELDLCPINLTRRILAWNKGKNCKNPELPSLAPPLGPRSMLVWPIYKAKSSACPI